MDLRQRVADWRELNKEADSWGGSEKMGAHVVWSEVTGLCGFWDGSCENGTWGAGIMTQIFTRALGWVPFHKKMWPCAGSEFA